MSELARSVVRVLKDQKAFGKYRGHVVDNADPDNRGRLKIAVPALLGSESTDWALPCLPCGGRADQGWLCVPPTGARVWVEFEGGSLSSPIWTGTFWETADEVPSEIEDQTTTRIWKTGAGHVLLFEDASGSARIRLRHAGGANVEMDEKGSLAIADKNGARVALDAERNEVVIEDTSGNTLTLTASGTTVEDSNGNKIEMASAGISVKAMKVVIDAQQVALGGEGGEPVIKGQSFLGLFATHMHTCTAPGSPSSPPIPQGEMSTLSFKVKAG